MNTIPRPQPSGTIRKPRLLLINPRFPESFWSFRWALDRVLPGKRAINPPLGLATLAALTPPSWEVRIVDENVEPVPLDPQADLIGVCGMAVQFGRQQELLRYYRGRGYFVVAGGSYASLCPERYADLADAVVAGEAEYIWPAFCRDFTRGASKALYREEGVVDLADSPTPRFDLLKLDRYSSVSMQFSRGCPYRCEFCDIIVMFGRRPRTKSPEQIGRELDLLRRHGVRSVFFVDDNLIGHKAKAKELLRYLIEYQRAHAYRLQFGTEASLNMAEDGELLRLFRAAGFGWVFIGIESPDEAALRETGKTQNTRQDILGALRRIYAHGIDVLAGFIVGFDQDTPQTFERQYRFIRRAGIQVAMVGLLTALPRTPLYARVQREGRLITEAAHADNTGVASNILPRGMSYDTLVDGYRDLYRRLLRDACIAARIRNKTRHLHDPVDEAAYGAAQRLQIAARLLVRGVLAGGPRRCFYFASTLLTCPPRAWPQVAVDWIAGLALQDYARRRFGATRASDERRVRRVVSAIRARCAECLRRGHLEVAHGAAAGQLRLTLRGPLDRQFFGHAVRRLERLLRHSGATLSLRIDALGAQQRDELRRLLARLARYGDRVSIRVDHGLRPLLAIDSSVFHVVLD